MTSPARATGLDPAPKIAPSVEQAGTAVWILAAVSVSHLLNDTLQSLLPAIYPLLKASFALSFLADRLDDACR